MGAIQAICGVHAPNTKFSDFRWDVTSATPDGADAAWSGVQSSGASWVKLLYPDHTRADAERAHALGLRVLVRAPGEGNCHFEDVLKIINEFEGVCAVVECGNEPNTDPEALWKHAFYLELVHDKCDALAKSKGITLCTPGWRNATSLSKSKLHPDLINRLVSVYRQYDAIGVHVYDNFRLAFPDQLLATLQKANPSFVDPLGRVNDWIAVFADRERDYYITEAGIAARLLPNFTSKDNSDIEKVDRYYSLLSQIALNVPRVRGVFFFLLQGTDGFARFDDPGVYSPTGHSSYHLTQAAWAHLGQKVRF